MILSSRPNAPAAILLLTGEQCAGSWNGRNFPAFSGFSDSDTQTIFSIASDAFKWWNISVTTDPNVSVPHSTIGYSNLFGGYPVSGGQANEGSFGTPGINAFVFVDQLSNLAWAIGRDTVHEAAHTLGLNHVSDANGPYAPGFWMGNCLVGSPQWTPGQRTTLDQRFGPASDVNGDGFVNIADANLLRDSRGTLAELMAVARDAKYGK